MTQIDDIKAFAADLDLPIMVTTADLDAPGPLIEFVNAAMSRQTGYRLEEMVGRSPRMLQGEATDRRELSRVRDALAREDRCIGEVVNYRKNGEPYLVCWSVSPVYGDDGVLSHWISVQSDRTRLRDLDVSQPVGSAGVWDWDPVAGELFLSPNLKHRIGLLPRLDPMPLAAWLEFVHPEDRPSLETGLEQCREERAPGVCADFRVRCLTGDVRRYRLAARRVQGPNGDRVCGAVAEIGSALPSDMGAAPSELAEVVPLLLAHINGDMRVTFANRHASRLVGRPLSDIVGRPVAEAFGAATFERLAPYASRALAGEAHAVEIETTFDGVDRVFHCEHVPSFDAAGRVTGYYFAACDTTNDRELMRRLGEAQQSRNRFLASASHDLRQPVQAIGLLASALADEALPEHAARIVEQIERSNQELHKMLGALLDISRLDAGMVTPDIVDFPVRDLVSEVVRELEPKARAGGVVVKVRVGSAKVASDPALLRQVIRNLLSNAILHAPGATVEIAARVERGMLLLSIADDGPGIPTADQEKVFEEFVQLGNPARDRRRGLGLGLSLVRRLCRLLGHVVSLRSAVGEGTTVALELPLRGEEETSLSRLRAGATDEATGRGVLLIEDDVMVRRSLTLRLRSWGFRANGFESLADAEPFLNASRSEVDVAIVDLRLANGECGIDVVGHLDEIYAIPAMLLTGDTDPDVLSRLGSLGCPVLHKPIDTRDLKATLDSLMGAADAGPVGQERETAPAGRCV